ncbi:MAG: response regulator [Nitrospiraceae bacterium]|nr:MAG: response regulator [Nitrospiraceae bacterium]
MNKLKVLVADSTASVRQFIKYALEDHFPGIVIEMANNGKNIQQRLESSSFDLILYEKEMPLLDGATLLEWIRQHETLKPLPFIMMSPATDEESLKKVIHLGADSYLVKPFKAESVVSKVTSLLNKPNRKTSERYRADGEISIRTSTQGIKGKLLEIGAGGLTGVIDRQEQLPHILEKVEAGILTLNKNRIDGIPGVIVRMEAVEAIPDIRHIAIVVRFIDPLVPEKKKELEGFLSALS